MSSADARVRGKGRPPKSAKQCGRTAFITAPAATDTSVIRRLLKQHGIEAFAADEFELPGAPLSMLVKEAIDRADLVIAVLDGREERENVRFELGVAQGVKKPTLIIAAKDEASSWAATTGIPYLRARPDDSAALEFGLAQFLAAPHHERSGAPAAQKETHPLGHYADDLLAALHAHQEEQGDEGRRRLLQDIIVKAIQASGVSTVSVDEKQGDARIDIAVWVQ